MKTTKFLRGILSGVAALPFFLAISLTAPQAALADRCSSDAQGNWSCSHNKRTNYYWCNGYFIGRPVRWQVPEGSPPSGGWPVAFYYAGTQLTDTSHAFARNVGDSYGRIYEPQMIHELLDDPNNTGKKYAVMVADPPASSGWLQYWHTNTVYPYSASCDYDFFPDFFGEIKSGKYGSASQYNMNKRYAYGISSGGYNTSRMAVTFNSGSKNGDTWKALGIVAASYANCGGSSCYVPTLPSNHPATKFWHGTNDGVVPIQTMRDYYNKLINSGHTAEKAEYPAGHEYTSDVIGAGGVKAWFDQH